MRTMNKKHRSASIVWTVAVILLIGVMLTSSVVGASIALFADAREPDTVIDLLPPLEKWGRAQQRSAAFAMLTARGNSRFSMGRLSAESGTQPTEPVATPNVPPRFRVSDNKQSWGRVTDIDLFRVSYTNGSGVITVAGKNGDKVVAPGTSNSYLFHLTNDGDAAINYDMKITATLSDNLQGYTIPVRVRLSDERGAWLCGSAQSWESFTALDGIRKRAVLGANCYSACLLEWEWPYESGDDAFDTLLGNLAVNEDLVLTIHIDVVAEYNADPNATGGIPKTGDDSQLTMWILLMLLSLAGLIATLTLGLRKGKRSEV